MFLLDVLNVIIGIGSLVCFIVTIIKMFQNDDRGIGIASIVLLFICGIGGLLAFIFGWVKAKEYDNVKVMLIWTGLTLVSIALSVVKLILVGPQAM